MEKRPPRPMTLFDELTMPPQFRMMKLMLPYTPATMRPMLAIFIKFMELQHTIQLFSQNPNALSPTQDSFSEGRENTQGFSLHMIEEILPYLSPQEQEMFENMRNMMSMMEMMQMMQEMQEPFGNSNTQNTQETASNPEAAFEDEASSASQTDFSNKAPASNPSSKSNAMGFSGLNPMDLLQNMLPPQQQEMFRTYQNLFEMEGDDSHERMDESSATEGH